MFARFGFTSYREGYFDEFRLRAYRKQLGPNDFDVRAIETVNSSFVKRYDFEAHRKMLERDYGPPEA